MPPGWTPQRAFDEAALVFRGLVTATELSPTELRSLPTGPETSFTITGDSDDGRFLVNVRYQIQEVFKGSPKADGLISTTDDRQEGVASFVEGRPPKFTGN